MANKLSTKRRYRFSDADFKQVADQILKTARRDINELAAYGVTEAWLAEIEAAIEAFANVLIDIVLQGQRRQTTYTKNNTRTAILALSAHLIACAQQHYDEDNITLRYFQATALVRQDDEELLRTARLLALRATQHAPALALEGFTATNLAQYQTHIANLHLLLDDMRSNNNDRQMATYHRIDLGNALYAMLRKLSAKGKLCWIDSSPARYSHYILDARPRKKATKHSKTTAPE